MRPAIGIGRREPRDDGRCKTSTGFLGRHAPLNSAIAASQRSSPPSTVLRPPLAQHRHPLARVRAVVARLLAVPPSADAELEAPPERSSTLATSLAVMIGSRPTTRQIPLPTRNCVVAIAAAVSAT